jgi:hypothetical protein
MTKETYPGGIDHKNPHIDSKNAELNLSLVVQRYGERLTEVMIDEDNPEWVLVSDTVLKSLNPSLRPV